VSGTPSRPMTRFFFFPFSCRTTVFPFVDLRRAICWCSCVMRCAGSTGSDVGASSSPGILWGSSYTSSGEVSLSIVGPRSTWWLLSMSDGSVPRLRWQQDGMRLYRIVIFHTVWSGIARAVTQTDVPGRW
jgi:hypothetical protein